MTSGSLRNYLSGKANIGGILQDKLRALDCNIDWLLTGEGNPLKSQENVKQGGRALTAFEIALLDELQDAPDMIPDLISLVRTQKEARKLTEESKSILDKLKGKTKKKE